MFCTVQRRSFGLVAHHFPGQACLFSKANSYGIWERVYNTHPGFNVDRSTTTSDTQQRDMESAKFGVGG